MKPEYIEELADIADPQQLWRLSGVDQLDLSPNDRKQLDTGVALRRHAAHIRQLRHLLNEGKSLLITPLSPCGNAIKFVDTPTDHQTLRTHKGGV